MIMKRNILRTSFIVLCAVALMFTSCDGGKKNNGGIKNNELVGKWEVGSNDLGIVSVEFSSNNYIVVTTAELPTRGDGGSFTYFGTYTIKGNDVILSDLGTITITSLGSGTIGFSVVMEDGTVSINGDKAEETITTSTKTDLLCRTWKFVSESSNPEMSEGEDTDEGEGAGEGEEEDPAEYVYFSKAGTYFVSFASGNSMLSSWKWKSEAEGTIYWSDEVPIVESEENIITIETLTASTLVVREDYDDGDYISYSRSTWEAVK